jgi:hypothetical protein
LVTNWPSKHNSAALQIHFTQEYLNIVGSNPSPACLKVLVETFARTIRVLKGKNVFRCEQGKSWLETDLPVAVQETCPAPLTTPEQVAPSKILQVEVNVKELVLFLSNS